MSIVPPQPPVSIRVKHENTYNTGSHKTELHNVLDKILNIISQINNGTKSVSHYQKITLHNLIYMYDDAEEEDVNKKSLTHRQMKKNWTMP